MNLGTPYCDEDALGMAIMDKLGSHDLTRDLSIKVRVENGWVELTGHADSNTQKQAAQEIVNAFNEIKGITNKIRVRPVRRIC
jgi:osmotically-inducible protein OsmY